MDRKEIKKNKLDLEYHRHLQISNAMLIFLTTGLLGFVGSFIFLLDEKNKLFLGLGISTFILITGYYIYKKINRKLDSLSKELDKI